MTPVRAELCLLEGDEVRHVEPVGPHGLRLGRAPGNDLVLVDPAVSGHHAAVDWDGAQLVLTDLASRNGTTVGGRPVAGRVLLAEGDVLELGGRVRLRVHLSRGARPGPAWELEVGGAVRIPIRRDRMRLGGSPDADLLLPGAPPTVATLLVVGDEVHLATDDDDVALAEGVSAEVAGTTLCLRRVDPSLAATVPVARTTYAYHLDAAIEGPTGPTAILTDPATGRAHRVTAENRALLLWLLGRRWRDDEVRDEPGRGWCSDEEVLAGLWGREGTGGDPTRVRVLLCRLRRELDDAGLDGACLEKRQGHLRLRLGSVALTG
jgi:hypothetical protein